MEDEGDKRKKKKEETNTHVQVFLIESHMDTVLLNIDFLCIPP